MAFLIPLLCFAVDRPVTTAAEIAAAAAEAAPGDTLTMADGVWQDADIVFEGIGTEHGPITLRARTPGRVILSGRSRLRIGGEFLVVDGLCFQNGWVKGHVIAFRRDSKRAANHCRVTNCAVIDYNPPDKKTDSRWVSLYGTHNRVDHCYLGGKNNSGTTLVVWLSDGPNHHLIDRNHFGSRPYLGWNGGETIRIGTSKRSMVSSRTVVENNLFEECSGEAEIISDKSCDNIHRYNTFRSCGGALTLRHGNRDTVEANWFIGGGTKGTGGVRVIGEGHRVFNNCFVELTGRGHRAALSLMNGMPDGPLHGYAPVKDVIIAHNTFFRCRQSVVLGCKASRKLSVPPSRCRIANNLLFSDTHPLIEAQAELQESEWIGNVFQAPKLGIAERPGLQQAVLAGRSGVDGVVRFEPAQNASRPVLSNPDDIDGQPRGIPPHVGCDQTSDALITRRPLTAADVGPGWDRGGHGFPAGSSQ
jgi:poly(beta-D-mannuronate) lyase